ncbi:hypothetical protein ACQRIU_006919 [Beauveria bassiana]
MAGVRAVYELIRSERQTVVLWNTQPSRDQCTRYGAQHNVVGHRVGAAASGLLFPTIIELHRRGTANRVDGLYLFSSQRMAARPALKSLPSTASVLIQKKTWTSQAPHEPHAFTTTEQAAKGTIRGPRYRAAWSGRAAQSVR